MSVPLFAIIDCAIKAPSTACFNRLVFELDQKFEYHWPSHYGLASLERSQAQAFIVLGSFSNVEDRLDWQRDLALFLDAKLKANLPVLGICFAHQLMADFYGARVIAANQSHTGARVIHVNAVDELALTNKQYHWIVQHSFEVTDLPKELIALASSPSCQCEIIAHQSLPFVGVQAHPEASLGFVQANFELAHQQVPQQVFQDGLDFMRVMIKKMRETILHNQQKALLSPA
jgi:GMP synthase (glutamine-hydrolysing)